MTANKTGGGRVVVACFCLTFLPAEARHIYRQIVGLRGRWRPVVLTQKRVNAPAFPFPAQDLALLPRSPLLLRELRRFWFRRVRPAPIPFSAGETRAVLRELEHRRAALLHVYFGQVAARLLPVLRAWQSGPIVVSFHGADAAVTLDQTAHRRAAQEVFARATLVLARSESLLAALRALGCPPEKLRLHRTGIPLGEFPFVPRDWAAAAASGRWRLLQAGRLIEKKGLRTSLLAFAEFTKLYPNARFTIAGDGPLRGELEILSQKLAIDALVEFTGFVSQKVLRAQLAAAHFFLHPSERAASGDQEGVPNALLEAMSTGLPVLATCHGGIPEAVAHGESGWLVAEGAAAALAAGLRALAASDPARLAEIGQAASAAVAANFAQDAQVARLEAIYDEARTLRR